MKKRRLIILALLLVALGFGLWQANSADPRAPSQLKATITKAKPLADAHAALPVPPPYPLTAGPDDEGTPVTTNSPVRSAAVAQLLSTHPAASRARVVAALDQLNQKPIELYGKVVDQSGKPLEGVAAYASVIYNYSQGMGVSKTETKTDKDGLFSFKGLNGRTLGIGLDKDGYEYDGAHGPFQYTELVKESERYHPDPKNPVVFMMYKLQGAEPMIKGNAEFKLAPDGTPMRIDLKTGKKTDQGGDLIVAIKLKEYPIGEKPTQRTFDWSAEISAVEGGMIVSTQKIMYLAPAEGYKEVMTLDAKATDSPWENVIDRSFYLKSENKIYSRIVMHFVASQRADNPSRISLIWYLNPSGSRNLEFDEKKKLPLQTD